MREAGILIRAVRGTSRNESGRHLDARFLASDFRTQPYCVPAFCMLSSTWSMLKLAGVCLGGNS